MGRFNREVREILGSSRQVRPAGETWAATDGGILQFLRDVVEVADASLANVAELRAEVERLRATLAPFAAVGRAIPESYPGHCRLREDSEYRDPETHHGGEMGWNHWLAYWGVNDGGLLPTIDDWRAAAEAAGGTDVDARAT